MWTDMSEIVRPTRDGIHGREFISTVVDIGYKPNYLVFDEKGMPIGAVPQVESIPLPVLFDAPPPSASGEMMWRITAGAAERIGSLAVIPIDAVLKYGLERGHVIPLVKAGEAGWLGELSEEPAMIEMDGWDEGLFKAIRDHFSNCQIILRIPFPEDEALAGYVEKGIQSFHLLADYHGQGRDGMFVLELIRAAHGALVDAGIRQEVTLIGSGGMIAAEHIPKAILCGLDAVALDTPALAALQAKFEGECADRETSQFHLPKNLNEDWGVQRLMNLTASWRDQLLEILGAMGLREVRRMRGEMGRAMFMIDLEKDAFAGVMGYERA
jgi:hypothetical protein